MAAQANTDVVALELEKVRSKLPLLFERDNVLFAKIEKKGDKVSSRSMRVPLELRSGGRFGKYDPDGGDMGRGGGSQYAVGTLTPVHFRFAVEINKLVEMAQRSNEQAIANAAKKEVKKAMAQFRGALDKQMNGPKTGILGTIASGEGTTTLVITADSAFQVAQKFYVGQGLHASDLTTTRANTVTVASVSDPQTITVSAAITAAAAGDTLAIEGSVAASGAITSTSLFGIPEFQNSSTSGTYLGLTRSSYPEVLTPEVAAASASLSTAHVRLALNKIKMALGAEAATGLTVYLHPAQKHAYEDLGIIISEIAKNPSSKQGFDPFFNPTEMAGWPILESINASRTRIDFLNLESWGRAVMEEIDYHEVGGNTVFPVYASAGGLSAASLFYFTTSFQNFVDNPRKGAYVSGLAKPSGY